MLTLIAVLFAAVAGLLAALGVPLARRRVPPNAAYGLRTPATLADAGVWYAANARAGREGIGVGVLLAALAVAIPAAWPRIGPTAYAAVWLAGLVGAESAVALRGWRHAERLLAARRRDEFAPAAERDGAADRER